MAVRGAAQRPRVEQSPPLDGKSGQAYPFLVIGGSLVGGFAGFIGTDTLLNILPTTSQLPGHPSPFDPSVHIPNNPAGPAP